MPFTSTLAEMRRHRRLSQQALSNLSGVSQRHLSFLESGRSAPGPSAIGKLVKGMKLSYAETNRLYLAAGLAPPRPALSLQDPRFRPAQQAITKLMQSHDPNPALATLRSGNILLRNQSFDAALNWAFGADRPWRPEAEAPDNLYDLTLHPDGLRRFMHNPEEILPHTMRRLTAASQSDPETKQVLARCRRYAGLAEMSSYPEPASADLSSVLVERYEIHGAPLNLVSMVASFGSPEDVTAQTVQIELFFPDDTASAETLTELADG